MLLEMGFEELAEKGIWTQAMSDAAKEAVVLLCSPGTDTSLEKPDQKCKTWCSTSMGGQKLAPRSLIPAGI